MRLPTPFHSKRRFGIYHASGCRHKWALIVLLGALVVASLWAKADTAQFQLSNLTLSGGDPTLPVGAG